RIEDLPQPAKQAKIDEPSQAQGSNVDPVGTKRIDCWSALSQDDDTYCKCRARQSGCQQRELRADAAVLQRWHNQKDLLHKKPTRVLVASLLVGLLESRCLWKHGKVRQIAVLVIVIEAVTDHERIGNIKSAVIGLKRDRLPAALA